MGSFHLPAWLQPWMRQETPVSVQDPADLGTELGLEIRLAAQAQGERRPAPASASDALRGLPLAPSAPSDD